MSVDAFHTMLDRLKALPVKTIDVIGGEPTIHPGIVRIIREAERRGYQVNLSSNGTQPDVLREMLSRRTRLTVGISINDRETLEDLRDFVQRQNPVVKTVFHRPIDTALIRDIISLRPEKFYLIYRDAMERAELVHTVPFPQFMNTVANHANALQVGTVYCSGFIPDIQHYPELAHARCPAGTTKLGVMPDGSVYPCNLLFGRTEFLLGNILTDPFEVIWRHPALGFFRSFAENACMQTSCELHGRCHGGCPAHSLLLSGDIAAPDPRCSPA